MGSCKTVHRALCYACVDRSRGKLRYARETTEKDFPLCFVPPSPSPFLRTDAEKEWCGPFCFIQAADPQLGLMKAWKIGDCDGGGDEWAEEVQLTRQAVQAVNKLSPRPRFMILCGDLVHAMPGEIAKHQAFRKY